MWSCHRNGDFVTSLAALTRKRRRSDSSARARNAVYCLLRTASTQFLNCGRPSPPKPSPNHPTISEPFHNHTETIPPLHVPVTIPDPVTQLHGLARFGILYVYLDAARPKERKHLPNISTRPIIKHPKANPKTKRTIACRQHAFLRGAKHQTSVILCTPLPPTTTPPNRPKQTRTTQEPAQVWALQLRIHVPRPERTEDKSPKARPDTLIEASQDLTPDQER